MTSSVTSSSAFSAAQTQAMTQANLSSLQDQPGVLLAQSNNPTNGGRASDIGKGEVQGYGPDGKTVYKATITMRVYNDGSAAVRFYANGKALPPSIQTSEQAKVYARQQIGKGTLGQLPAGNPDAFGETSDVTPNGRSMPRNAGRMQKIEGDNGKVAVNVYGRVFTTELKARQTFKDGKWQADGFVSDGLTVYSDKSISVNQKRETYGYFDQSIGKQRVITRKDNTVITSLPEARARVTEMIQYGGLSMMTDARAQQAARNKPEYSAPVQNTTITDWKPPIPLPKPIEQMGAEDRLKYMVKVALPLLPEAGKQELMNLLTPQSLAMMAAFSGAQFVPVVNVLADAVALLLLGKDVIDTGGKVAKAISTVLTTNQPYQLVNASKDMAEAFVHVLSTGVQTAGGLAIRKGVSNYKDGAPIRNLEKTLVKFQEGTATANDLRRAVIVANQSKNAASKKPGGTNAAPEQPPQTSGSAASRPNTPPAVETAGQPSAQPAVPPRSSTSTAGANRATTPNAAELAKVQTFVDGIGTPQIRSAVADGANAIWQAGGKVDGAKLKALKAAAEADFVKTTVPAIAEKVFAAPALQAKLTEQLTKNAAGNPSKAKTLANSPEAVQKLATALVLPELETAAFAGSKVPKTARDAFSQKALAWAREQQPNNPAGALEMLKGKPAWHAGLIKEVLVDQITGTTAKTTKTLATTDPAAAQVQNTFRQRVGNEIQQKYPSASSQKDLLAQAGGQARTELVRGQLARQLGGDSPLAEAVYRQLVAEKVGERNMVKLINSPQECTRLLKTALIEQTRSSKDPSVKLSPMEQLQLRKAIDKRLANFPNEAAKQQDLKRLSNSNNLIEWMTKGTANIPPSSGSPTPSTPSTSAAPTGRQPGATPTPATRPGETPAVPTTPGGAIVLVNPAAVTWDIPPPPKKTGSRVGSVYGKVEGTSSNGVSDATAINIARTLQQANPNTYGKRTVKDIVDNNVRADPDSSLFVVVREKNIEGQSSASDSTGTRTRQATAAEYAKAEAAFAAIKDPNAFGAAMTKMSMGAGKIYERIPDRDSSHATTLESITVKNSAGGETPAPRGGLFYGYVGQVVGDNLVGSGGQAMAGVQNLARAANMKGLTLYTNAQIPFYEGLGFTNVAQTTKAGVTSTHMVWENPNYNPNYPTLNLSNPRVVNALKNPPPEWGRRPPPAPASPPPGGGSGTPPGGGSGTPPGGGSGGAATPATSAGTPASRPTTQSIGPSTTVPGSSSIAPTAKDMKVSFNGLQTRIVFEGLKTKVADAKTNLYESVSVGFESKIGGPILDLSRNVASGVTQRVLLPSARVLNDRVIEPAMQSPIGKKLTSVIDAKAAQFNDAAFEAKLRVISASNSEAGLVLRDMANLVRRTGQGAGDVTFKALSASGQGLQKMLPRAAAATAVILTNAAATGKLRVVTVEAGVVPTGEVLMVKKALNIPNGLRFNYMIADTPGMESVGGRAIFAFGGGESAVITPATGPGQSGVSQPWVGRRPDGSIVTAATGAAYGPNAFFGWSLGTTNINISDFYSGQLGRVSANPVSASAGGVRPSGRGADFKMGVVAADLATWNHVSVLNLGPFALVFNRFRDPLSLKGAAISTESKILTMVPTTLANGQIVYTPFLDLAGKAGKSQIEPVVPIVGATTFDPKGKDIVQAGIKFGEWGDWASRLLRGSAPNNTPSTPPANQPYVAPKKP